MKMKGSDVRKNTIKSNKYKNLVFKDGKLTNLKTFIGYK